MTHLFGRGDVRSFGAFYHRCCSIIHFWGGAARGGFGVSCGGQRFKEMGAETLPAAARLLPMEGAGDGCFPRRKTTRRTGGIYFAGPCVATWAKLPVTFRRCRASISPIVQRRFGEVEKGFRAERKSVMRRQTFRNRGTACTCAAWAEKMERCPVGTFRGFR